MEKGQVKLNEFLTWLKDEIKKSEDTVTELEPHFGRLVPEKEARDLFFRTTDLEVELSVGITKSTRGGIQAWVLQLGKQTETENVQKVRIRLVSQGHKFSIDRAPRAKAYVSRSGKS